LSINEQDELVGVAHALGLGRADTEELHRRYLLALAQRAWADGVVTQAEHDDLRLVAILLGLTEHDVDRALTAAREAPPAPANAQDSGTWGQFQLRLGDLVVFTGQMRLPREVWEERAVAAGLAVHGNVTKKTRLVVAADPDSLSGKAKKAGQYGIPIVTEDAFTQLLEQSQTQEAR
jgi:DNA polymerase-3 subunit epsilon